MTNPDNPDNRPQPESETVRRVRWRTTATEAYTQLHQVYEELRESGHAYAWASAYEAAAMAGMLLADLGDLLNDRTVRPTPPPTQEPPCRTTQHCAAWGWCNRCDRTAADAGRFVVKAVDAMGIPPHAAGSVYAAAMDALRHPALRPVPARVDLEPGEDPCPGR